jgi:23S rRNA (adenine2503-C2)-methyltransferase
MASDSNTTDLKSMTRAELTDLAGWIKLKPYQAKDIFKFIHKHHKQNIDELTTISKAARQSLNDTGCYISNLEIIEILTDPDGTKKIITRTNDNVNIQTVLINDDKQDRDTDRLRRTVCISSQAGCKFGCKFCATGKMGFIRNLTPAEIIDQVYIAQKIAVEENTTEQNAADKAKTINNVVFMGMGEPFDNFDNCAKAAIILNDPAGANIASRRITLSTCGICEEINKFSKLPGQFRLAISLHSAIQNKRQTIMPVAKTQTLEKLKTALCKYQNQTGRRITIEYCMLAGVNDGEEDIKALEDYCRGMKVNINLIEFNDHAGSSYKAADSGKIKQFAQQLNSAGIETAIRYKRGVAIDAACGQLSTKQKEK